MKIVLVSGNLGGGGMEKVAILLANGFAARDIATDFLLLSAEGDYDREWISPKVNLICFSTTREKCGIKRRLDYLLKFWAYLRAENPDACITFENASDWLGVLGRVIFLRSMKLIFTIHSTISVLAEFDNSVGRTRAITAFLYRFADVIVAVSKASARNAEKYYFLPKGRVSAIYNPVISSEMLQLAQADVEHMWFREPFLPVILAVGSLRALKNYPLLIKAFAMVRKKYACKLLILGQGEERHALERLISDLELQDDIAMPGFVQNPYAYMSKASVLVLSSLVEGLPGVLIEALACGCPVISTNCPGGSREILQYGKYGTLVPVGDVPAMASAITEALEGKFPCTREERIARGREFSVDKAVEAYLEAITANHRSKNP